MRKLVQLFINNCGTREVYSDAACNLRYVNKLVKMCRAVKPLCSPRSHQMEVLNVAEYARFVSLRNEH